MIHKIKKIIKKYNKLFKFSMLKIMNKNFYYYNINNNLNKSFQLNVKTFKRN
jgi:hypothetical protein